jgi:hypothetical protein
MTQLRPLIQLVPPIAPPETPVYHRRQQAIRTGTSGFTANETVPAYLWN